MSIDNATPEEWDRVHQKLKNRSNDVSSPAHYNKGNIAESYTHLTLPTIYTV